MLPHTTSLAATVKSEGAARFGSQTCEIPAFVWRKRVGVEPTTLAAKDRINGFEGHEGHRTPFASEFALLVKPTPVTLRDNHSVQARPLLALSPPQADEGLPPLA